MSPLEAQKRLLIAESELNRTRLAKELASLGSGVVTITDGAARLGTMVSSLVTVVAGLVDRGSAAPAAPKKPSLVTTVIAGVGLATSLWQAFRSHGRNPGSSPHGEAPRAGRS